MEDSLFTCEDTKASTYFKTFYHVVLKVAIGEFPVGSKFEEVEIDEHRGLLRFTPYRHSPLLKATYKLRYFVGEKVR